MIGQSRWMRDMFILIDQVAPTNSTVLIQGETGTGKELVAKRIHERSLRKRRELVPVNCAAIPASLLESELFGFEKHAFTGANQAKPGKFEIASGSSLFLDEIAKMPLEFQAKLLRVLQERKVDRLGSVRPIDVDFRLIAATSRNLRDGVEEGWFLQDLYYRFKVIVIEIPPLRERPEDIPALVDHFVRQYARQNRKEIRGVSSELLALLMHHTWPGNVRELEHTIESLVVLSTDGTLRADKLPPEILPAGGVMGLRRPARRVSPDDFKEAWIRGKGDYERVAKLTGMHPNSVHRAARRHHLTDDLPRF